MITHTDRHRADFLHFDFLTIWFIGAIYSFTRGMRFAIILVPAFAIAFGVAIGIIYQYISKWLTKGFGLNKYLSRTILIIFNMLRLCPKAYILIKSLLK